ncbi:major capsid protein [Neisseria weaveri]|uniref:major capsid protein n=1 Tax=Neisseria weaveri TaxID=28091 RepID=UPI0007C9A9C6|nr:major capsid protein [Neisseria weaveri]SAY50689.1 putative inner membrane protein [Neisseria weaveri]
MGYRVGFQCVGSELIADDLVLSTVSPVLQPDGTILRPERLNDGWYLKGQKIKMSYPHCSPVEQIKDGASIGAALIGLIVVAVGFRWVIGMLKDLTKPTGA